MADKGRPNRPEEVEYTDTVAEKSALQAVLVKQDEIIEALKALTAKLDADSGDTGGDSDYAATVTDALEKVELK